MDKQDDVARHYTSGALLDRLDAALRDDGVDPDSPSIEALAPYDQFHGRGLEATEEIAAMLDIAAGDHVLDIGSGIGGPARYVARTFGCTVSGVDLTREFCEVGRALTRRLGLEATVALEEGNALDMPFADEHFDVAYSMNVSMNIFDKGRFYREIHRVLKPGARLALSEIALGDGDGPDYPTPWSKTADTSFLVKPEATCLGLEEAGFIVAECRNTVDAAKAYGARARAQVESGGKSPQRAVQLIHGDIARQAMQNSSRAVAEGRTVPIEVLCTKPRG